MTVPSAVHNLKDVVYKSSPVQLCTAHPMGGTLIKSCTTSARPSKNECRNSCTCVFSAKLGSFEQDGISRRTTGHKAFFPQQSLNEVSQDPRVGSMSMSSAASHLHEDTTSISSRVRPSAARTYEHRVGLDHDFINEFITGKQFK